MVSNALCGDLKFQKPEYQSEGTIVTEQCFCLFLPPNQSDRTVLTMIAIINLFRHGFKSTVRRRSISVHHHWKIYANGESPSSQKTISRTITILVMTTIILFCVTISHHFTKAFRSSLSPSNDSIMSSSSLARPASKSIHWRSSRTNRKNRGRKDHHTPFNLPPKGFEEAIEFSLPLTITSITDKVVQNGTIILTAVNYGYREMLMNWVCNMRQLQITNYLVASLDEHVYKFAHAKELPTYYESTLFNKGDIDVSLLAEATYGSDSFKLLTKMKSRVVLRFLQYGLNVIWTDCDIVYFKNPLIDLLNNYHGSDLVIQTNAPDNERSNDRRRINSGFYLVKSNERSVNAFNDIVLFAAQSRLSEQPCFYDVLCGKSGETRIGDDQCIYKNGFKVKFLNRHKYANGLTNNIWNTTGGVGKIKVQLPGLIILHNNWVKGSEKQARFQKQGFVFYNRFAGLCSYSKVI